MLFIRHSGPCGREYPWGDAKVNSKQVAPGEFYKAMKSQISSTKFQINLKSQYSMTKIFAKIEARRKIKSGEPARMALSSTADGCLVWIFEFR
jgi:hypothetical protein